MGRCDRIKFCSSAFLIFCSFRCYHLLSCAHCLSCIFQESLALQFWDKECFVDGPIRSILFMLEKEYPIHITEFVRLLSAVCEGSWPAECVYVILSFLLLFISVPRVILIS